MIFTGEDSEERWLAVAARGIPSFTTESYSIYTYTVQNVQYYLKIAKGEYLVLFLSVHIDLRRTFLRILHDVKNEA